MISNYFKERRILEDLFFCGWKQKPEKRQKFFNITVHFMVLTTRQFGTIDEI